MVEVCERGIKEEEIELDLGLSIGGTSFRRSEKPKLSRGETARSNSSAVSTATLSEAESVVMDSQVKREIQALRRQEAKRKREEKKTRAQTGEPPAKKYSVHVNMNMSIGGQAEGHHYPVGPLQYPYAPVQFVPYSNGFAYPCVVPCWASNGGGGGSRQFQTNQESVNKVERNGKTTSLNHGSPICSSSTISENYSAASHEGGSSDDMRSYSSRLDGSVGKKNKAQSDHTATTSHSAESNHNLVQPKEEPSTGNTEPVSAAKPVSPKQECPPAPFKQVKVETPKSKTESTKTSHMTPSVPQMPYVSATGKGPNGRTVHGFLYNYSKSEINIVCVCHGSTFSPAEFVQHAGGTEVSQPLRHITVIPSAFA